MRTWKTISCSRIAPFFLGAALTAPAVAQDAERPVEPPSADVGLEEIVVTAQRRSERLQDVPVAVTTISASIAESVGVTSPSNISIAAPAVTFQTTVNGGGITIRGVGGSFGTGDEPPNAVYIDGVYQASAPGFLGSFNNIEQIEVLKGPQGTLFGRNASGGVVQIITRRPSTVTHVDASIGYGNYDTISGNLYATSGITDNLAADIALAGEKMGDGYGVNAFTGRDIYKGHSLAARSKLLWDIGPDTSATLIGLYSKSNPWESEGGQVWPGYVDRGLGTGSGFRNARRSDETTTTVTQTQFALNLTHAASWADLTSITSYDFTRQREVYDQDGSPLDLLAFDLDTPFETWTQELRAQSKTGSGINWIGGIFLYDSVVKADPITIRGAAAAPFGGSYSYFTTAPTSSFAGFGQVSVPLGRTTLTAGGRYTIDDKGIDITVLNRSGAAIPSAFSANPRRDERSFSKFTYRLAVDHKFTDELMAYASYSTGFKAGSYGLVSLSPSGTTPDTAFPPPVSPQTVTAYETGLKSELLDRKLRLNVSAFYYDFKNIQLRVIVPGGNILLNAAKAHMSGVDLDVAWRPTSNLTLQGALSYLDGEYDDFPAPPYFRPAVNAAGVPTGGLVQFAGVNARGNTTVNSPELVASLIADYSLSTAAGEFGVVASYTYNDGYFYDPQNIFGSGSYSLVNGTVRWSPDDSAIEISAWVKNLLDADYIIASNTSALGPLYWANAPRTYGVKLRYKF